MLPSRAEPASPPIPAGHGTALPVRPAGVETASGEFAGGAPVAHAPLSHATLDRAALVDLALVLTPFIAAVAMKHTLYIRLGLHSPWVTPVTASAGAMALFLALPTLWGVAWLMLLARALPKPADRSQRLAPGFGVTAGGLLAVALLARQGNRRRADDLLEQLGPEDAVEPDLELPPRLLCAVVVDRGPRPERGGALFRLAEERALALGRSDWQRDILLRWADANVARDHAAAQPLIDRARALLATAPDPAASAVVTLLQARVDYHRGQARRAWGDALGALGALRSLGRGWWESQALLALAELAYLESRWTDAEGWAQQALTLAQRARANENIDFAPSSP
jgi:hypothetical protein